MKDLLGELRVALAATIVLTVISCGIYPSVVWGIAQLLFPEEANGSLALRGRDVVGSSLIGQPFRGPGYFHGRPSAAGSGYDATSSGGSNLGPISRKLLEAVEERVEAYRSENGLASGTPVPADAVTASGSGLDPDISVANALIQAVRVAKARGLDPERVLRLVRDGTRGPDLGFLGEARVNVLLLNLDLDRNAP